MGYIYDDGTTYTGSLVSFANADGVKKITSLVVPFSPTQAGSGVPSPSNVRTISGVTGVSAYVGPNQDQSGGTAYSADWTSVAGALCGGNIDLVNGAITVYHAIVDLSTLSWIAGSSPTADGSTAYVATITGMNTDNSNQDMISDVCSLGATKYISNMVENTMIRNNGRLIIAANSAPTSGHVVYPLATPVTYNVSGLSIPTLTGQNYVWTQSGLPVSVTVADYLHGFQGWLIKVGENMDLVPTAMIEATSYKVTPDQRMEESAERDVSGVLHRVTVPNMPPKIEFNTPPCYNSAVSALNAIFRAAYSVSAERKLLVAFYDPEEDMYKTWECYMPDVQYPMRTIDVAAKTILYDPIRYAFIGY